MHGMRFVHPLQRGIYTLLAANTLWYMASGPWTKALDSLAWFGLLILFAIETGNTAWLNKKHARSLVRILRFCAASAIGAAAFGYVQQQEWLDAANIGLWVLVILLIEIELRFKAAVAQSRRLFVVIAIVLYACIAGLIPFWVLRGEWFDAYDAVLWVVAFALIEMDALKLAR